MENRNLALLVVFCVMVLAYFFHSYPQGLDTLYTEQSTPTTTLQNENLTLSYVDSGNDISFSYPPTSTINASVANSIVSIVDRASPQLLSATMYVHNGYESYEWKGTAADTFAIDKDTKEWTYASKEMQKSLPSAFIGYTRSSSPIYKLISGTPGNNTVTYIMPEKSKNRVVTVIYGWNEANMTHMAETAQFANNVEKTVFSIK